MRVSPGADMQGSGWAVPLMWVNECKQGHIPHPTRLSGEAEEGADLER